MCKGLNILIICALSVLLIYMHKPRIERAYLHWRILSHTDGLLHNVSDWAEIYYTDQDAEYIPLILRLTDFYLPLILNDFGISNPKRVVIVVYSNPSQFKAAVGQLDVLPMGAYYGSVINLISPYLWMTNAQDAFAKDYFMQYGPLIHELTHYAVDLRVGKPLRTWLSEGVALYYEYKYTGVEWRPDLAKKAAGISMSELNDNFRQIDESVAYRKAFDAVRVFVRKYGEASLQQMLK